MQHEGDEYRRYTTLRDSSAVLLAVGVIGFIVLGGAFGPLGFLVDALAFVLPGGLLASKAMRVRPR